MAGFYRKRARWLWICGDEIGIVFVLAGYGKAWVCCSNLEGMRVLCCDGDEGLIAMVN
jgi:hypothetical protein